jgi:hypothetical protein
LCLFFVRVNKSVDSSSFIIVSVGVVVSVVVVAVAGVVDVVIERRLYIFMIRDCFQNNCN